MITNIISFSNQIILLHTILLQIGYLGLIAGIFYALKIFYDKNIRLTDKNFIKRQIPNILLLLMLLWSFISAMFAQNLHISFFGDLYRKEGFLTYLAYAGLYLSVFILKNDKYRQILMILFSNIAAVLSLLTIIQAFGVQIPGFEKNGTLSAIFYNSNHFAYYLTMASACAACFFFTAQNKKKNIFYLILQIIIYSALIFNNTFGCYLAVLFGLLSLIIIFSIVKRKFFKKAVLPVIIFILLSVIINIIFQNVGKNFLTLSRDITKIFLNDDAGSAGNWRWVLWTDALNFIKEKPVFGYGPDSLGEPYAKLGINLDRPHNEYIQFAASLGIPALILYLSALFLIFKKAYKNRNNISLNNLIALCVVFTYLMSAFFGNTMFNTSPYFFIFLAMSSGMET
jgi:O-antigen ligase